VDFAGQIGLDLQSETVKQQVAVKSFIDGDTTHFYVPETISYTPENMPADGVLKARYIAVNTPESTGQIEEWGKKASRFTREKLENAEEIWIESDDTAWNLDSTGARNLVWVWYRPKGEQDFRNLNIELLQNGLAIANSSAQNRYGDTCMAAIAQARAQKRNIYSGEKDPDFFYGDAIELTIKELRLHPEAYEGKKVAFTGVITVNHKKAVFIEDFDEETGLYFGFTAFYGNNMSAGGLDVLTVGNEVRIVGTVQYYEKGQSWQVAGLNYRMMKPNDPGNIQKLSEGHEPAWTEIDPEIFWQSAVIEDEPYPFACLALDTSVSMTVKAKLIEANPDGLFCLECSDCGEDSVKVYTPPLYDETGRMLSAEDFETVVNEERGITTFKIIRVHGIVSRVNDESCIRVYTQEGITFLD
jgi:endonuclease YncB( thermonuclease family)